MFSSKRGQKNIPQGVKASIALFLAQMITKGINYITLPLYTRLLTEEEYGRVAVYLTWEQVLGIIAMFCLSYGVFNNGMVDYPNERSEYALSMLSLSNLITICVFAVLLCLYPLIQGLIRIDLPLLLLMGIMFLVQPAYNFWTGQQRYELKYKATAFWTILCALLSPIGAIVCILFAKDNRVYARIFGAEGVLIVIYIGFYVHLVLRAKGKVRTSFWKAAFMFNLPLILHYLSANLLGSADKIMISHMVGDASTAYYNLAYSIASAAMIVWTAINASLIPFTYEKCKVKDYKSISAVTIPLLMLFAVVCTFVILLAPEVIAIMAPSNYLEAIYTIPPVVGGVFFQVQYFIYANILYYHKTSKYVMYASVTSVVANVILNYICIKQFGYIAAGYTTLACYLLQATIDYCAMKKVLGESVYNMRSIGILSLIVVAISLSGSLLYSSMLVRYILAASILVVAFLFRQKILEMCLLPKE